MQFTSRVKSAWNKFRELLPVLTDKSIPMLRRGHVFTSAVRRVMLHGSSTWAVTVEDCSRLVRNDNAMVRWICSARLADRVPMAQLRDRLGIPSIEDLLSQGMVMCCVCTKTAGKRKCSTMSWRGNMLEDRKRDGQIISTTI